MGENRGFGEKLTIYSGSNSRKHRRLTYIEHAHTEFNKNRKFIVRNIPPVTYEEIKEFVGSFSISNISISKKCRHAIVTLLNGEQVEEAVHSLNNKPLLGSGVEVCPLHNENLLCVTHLPFDLPEIEFRKHLEPYGIIEKCFLMRDNETGESKGYGFVEYAHNREKSIAACAQLDGRRLGSCVVQCSFLNNSVCHFEQLQSQSLLIDNLPANYKNIQELKNICSVVDKPDWLKLGEKDGIFLHFAVVSFSDFETAGHTQKQINGYGLTSNNIRVTYCRPGDDAKVLYDEILNMRVNRLETLKIAPPLLPAVESDNSMLNLNPYKLASPVVKKLLAENPAALGNFIQVLHTLQLQQPGQPQTGIQAPVLDPNMQIALLAVLITIQIQHNQPGFLKQPRTKEFIMNSLQNEQKDNRESALKSPLINRANTMVQNVILQNCINANDHDFTNENISDSRTSSYNLFPDFQNHYFETESLKDFPNIMSALTPRTTTGYKARTVTTRNTSNYQLRNQHGLPCTSPSLFSYSSVDSNDSSQVLTNNRSQDVPSLLDLPALGKRSNIGNLQQNRNSVTPCLLDIPLNQNNSSTMGNLSQGLVDCNPAFGYRQETNLQTMGSCDTGLADPFLASYIESQIKNHIAENQTLYNTNAQKPVSLLDLPVLQGNVNNSVSMGMDNAVQKRTKHNILGNLQSTPLSRNQLQPANVYVSDKRTLSFGSKQSTAENHGNGSNFTQIKSSVEPSSTFTQVQGQKNTSTSRNNYPVSLMNTVLDNNPVTGYQTVQPQPLLHYKRAISTLDNDVLPPEQNIHLDKPFLTFDKKHSQYPPSLLDIDHELKPTHNFRESIHLPSVLDLEQVSHPSKSFFDKRRNSMVKTRTIGMNNIHQSDQLKSLLDIRFDPPYSEVDVPKAVVKPLITSSRYFKNTPTGSKRKFPHLIPSPEASPDGPYIGQHSQGLGGHYAASYSNKRIKIG